ncbi:MAG TPA: hypothetical protein PKJ45_10380 [Rubrivivax sp.]|nr:hypothetical protein [Rubrivivax sp.]
MKLISWICEKAGIGLFMLGLFLFALSSKTNLKTTQLLGKVLKDAANAKG